MVGDINGRRPIIVDDLMAGGSVLKQIDDLYRNGAEGKACFAITHPVLAAQSARYLILRMIASRDWSSPILFHSHLKDQTPKITVLSIAPLLADIIYRIHEGLSISEKLILT